MKARIALGLGAIVLILLSVPSTARADEDGVFTVALTGQFPPFSMYDENGELAGFDVDISRAIAQHLGQELEIIAGEWDTLLPGLKAEKFDAIIGSMAMTPDRATQVNFSAPYYHSGAQLFIHKNLEREIESIQDCGGRRIGVVQGTTYERHLDGLNKDKNLGIEIVTYNSDSIIFEEVENGRLAGFISDQLVGRWQIERFNRPFLEIGRRLYIEHLGIPVRTEDTELLARINEALTEMHTTKEIDRIHAKYFGKEEDEVASMPEIKVSTIVRKLAKGFAVTLGVAAASLLIGFALAIPCGVALNLNSGPVYFVVRGIVDFLRGTPVLVQLFFVYFGLPAIGVTLSPVASAVLTLSINAMAYMAEVVRSGLMSVDRGQILAGRALGLNRLQVFRLIIWPQAFRIAIPPLMNSVVALTKDTALISIISVSEVMREARSIISVTFQPMTYYFIVAVMFFAVTFPLMKLAGRLEAKIRRRGFVHD